MLKPTLSIVGFQFRRKNIEELSEGRSTSILDDGLHQRHMVGLVNGRCGRNMVHIAIYAWPYAVASRR